MPQLSEAEKLKVIFLNEEGYKQNEIATKMGKSQATISRLLSKYTNTKSLDHAGGNGRPSTITEPVARVLNEIREENSFLSLRKMAAAVEKKLGKNLSPNTIRNFFNSENVFAYNPLKKPLLKPIHVERREMAAKSWLFMDESETKRIIFSDESKFNLFYTNGKVKVWRKPGEALDPKNCLKTIKHGGGSLMVWGCFSYYGVGNLVFIENTMKKEDYVNILSQNLFESARKMGIQDFYFQQDNDPKHTSGLAKEFFAAKNIKVISWPAQSPDLNPIENLWGIIKEKINEMQPKTLRELKELIQSEWAKISVEMCMKLANSFRKRTVEVLKAKGGYTHY